MSKRNGVVIWIVAIIASSQCGAAATDSDHIELPSDAVHALHSDGKATLYSLDPSITRVDLPATFHHWPVLGQANLNPDQKKIAVQSFDKAIAALTNGFSHCFAPRHAMRIKWRGHVYDYLICYTCRGLEVDRDGKVLAFGGVPGVSPLELNDLMTQLHLPLAQSSQAWLEDQARRKVTSGQN